MVSRGSRIQRPILLNGTHVGERSRTKRSFEFYGPQLGPFAIMVGLPLICYGLFFACHQGGCLALRPTLSLPSWPHEARVFSWEALAAYTGFIIFQVSNVLEMQCRRHRSFNLVNSYLNVVCAVIDALWYHWRSALSIWYYQEMCCKVPSFQLVPG